MKKMISAVLILALVFSLCACGKKEEPKIELDLENYKQQAADIVSEAYSDMIYLGNMVKYEANYISSYKSISGKNPEGSACFEKAVTWIEENMDITWEGLSTNNAEISEKYQTFAAVEIGDNQEAADIREYMKTIYENYIEEYTGVQNGDVSKGSEALSEFYNTAVLLQSSYLAEYLEEIE